MIDVKVDDRSLQQGFLDVAEAARRLEAVFRRLVAPMRADQREHADKEEGPEGEKWPARKYEAQPKLFAKAKRATKKQPARHEVFKFGGLLGALPEMVQVRSLGASVWARHPIAWASAQAMGDVVGRGVRLPPRPFVYVSQQLGDKAVAMINDHLQDAWKKGPTP